MSNRTHIAVVTQPIGSIGIRQLRPLCKLLDELAELTVITATEQPEKLAEYKTKCYSNKNTNAGILSAGIQFGVNQIRMANAIQKSDADIVWFYGSPLYAAPVVAAKALGKTVVSQPKGNVPLALYLNWDANQAVKSVVSKALSSVESSSYAVSDYVVTYTPSMADSYGIDHDGLLPFGARYVGDEFERRRPIQARPNAIGYLGRLSDDKNVETVVEIAKQATPHVHIGGDGPQLSDVRRECADDDGVTVHGWIDNPVEFLNSIRLLYAPCTPIEGLPTVLMETVACGTPAVVRPACGVPDIVIDGETGVHVESNDPRRFVSAIHRVIDDDLKAYSDNCVAFADEQLRYEAALKRYEAVVAVFREGDLGERETATYSLATQVR